MNAVEVIVWLLVVVYGIALLPFLLSSLGLLVRRDKR